MMNKEIELKKISEDIRKCTKCRLWKNRKNAVSGEGPFDASIIFIGESPGKHEDETGRPFVGRSGELFNQLLELSKLERRKVYITSVIKCHPPKNRNPKSDELDACINTWMNKQIFLINPNFIVVLGAIALQSLLGKKKIKQYRGKIISKGDRNYYITYHPAVGLRNPKLKEKLEKDFKNLSGLIKNKD